MWDASVFESRTFALSTMPIWIQHGGSSPASACERVGVIVPCLDMPDREPGAAA